MPLSGVLEDDLVGDGGTGVRLKSDPGIGRGYLLTQGCRGTGEPTRQRSGAQDGCKRQRDRQIGQTDPAARISLVHPVADGRLFRLVPPDVSSPQPTERWKGEQNQEIQCHHQVVGGDPCGQKIAGAQVQRPGSSHVVQRPADIGCAKDTGELESFLTQGSQADSDQRAKYGSDTACPSREQGRACRAGLNVSAPASDPV